MQKVILTQKDIEKAGIQFSESGDLIDELCFSINGGSFEDCDYYDSSPIEVYNFDYEEDLLKNTEDFLEYQKIIDVLDIKNIHIASYQKQKHFGAWVALEYPSTWKNILGLYEEYLKENGSDTISEVWNKELEKEQVDYIDDCYYEFLYGDQSNNGVIYDIWRKYGYEGDFSKKNYDREKNTFTFGIYTSEIKDAGYKYNQGKKYLLDIIYNNSNNFFNKNKEENRKRREENEKTRLYKEEVLKSKEEKRKQKLLEMLG